MRSSYIEFDTIPAYHGTEERPNDQMTQDRVGIISDLYKLIKAMFNVAMISGNLQEYSIYTTSDTSPPIS